MQRDRTVAVCDHKYATVVGSQQRLRSRDQTRRSSLDCKIVRNASGKPIKQWCHCSAREKLMRVEMTSFADVSGAYRLWAQLPGSHEQLTSSGSEKSSVEYSE